MVDHVLLSAIDAFLETTSKVKRQSGLMAAERKLERGMAHAFAVQQASFMRMFKRLKPLFPEIQEAVGPEDWEPLFDASELSTLNLFELPLSNAMRTAMLIGGQQAMADLKLGLAFDLDHPEAVKYLQTARIRITGINDSTREEIRGILTDGVSKGLSYDNIAKNLTTRFKEFRTPATQSYVRSRAHLIAITETGDAYTQGAMTVGRELKAAGLEIEKSWIAEPDACELCEANAEDGWIGIDDTFSSGDDGPTAHPACRCDVEQKAVFSNAD